MSRDLVLQVEESQRRDGRTVLIYTLDSTGSFKSEPFDYDSILEAEEVDPGVLLARRLLPEELRRVLWPLRHSGRSLLIVSNESRPIPWKELVFEDPDEPTSSLPLVMAFSVTVRRGRPDAWEPLPKDRPTPLSVSDGPEDDPPRSYRGERLRGGGTRGWKTQDKPDLGRGSKSSGTLPVMGDDEGDSPAGPEKRDVQVSTVHPESVRPGARFLVEVFFHLEGHEIEESPGFEIRSGETILSLPDDTRLTVRLAPVDDGTFEIDRPEVDLDWAPPYRSAEFLIRARPDLEEGLYYDLRVEIWLGETQLAWFYLGVRADRDAKPVRHKSSVSKRIPRKAFASYAHLDKERVLPRLSGLSSVGIDVFLDCLDIRQAEDWEEVLHREIGSRDCLLLFWSKAASESAWVEREWRFALELRGMSYIIPNALDLPKDCPPPAELARLHFGSRFDHLA